jgi:copper transport protein
MFQVVVWPGRVGSDDFLLRLTAGDGSLPRAKEAIPALSLPERGFETA